jgi:hypothetical protein
MARESSGNPPSPMPDEISGMGKTHGNASLLCKNTFYFTLGIPHPLPIHANITVVLIKCFCVIKYKILGY